MSLIPSQRRAEEFARLLEGGGRTEDPALAPLVTLASALQALPVGPRPEFRDSLRQRLVAVAAVQAEPAPAPTATEKARDWVSSWRGQRRLAVAAGGLAAVTAIAGIGISGSRSLPGDPFYAVKTAAERVQLATTSGDLDRGKLHLDFARTRLDEVEALAGDSSASTIVSTLRRMDRETRAGTTDLTQAWHASDSAKPITILSSFATKQTAELTAVLPELPAPAKAQADQSLALLRGVAVVVSQMAAVTCADAPCPGVTTTSGGSTGTATSPTAPARTGTGTATTPGSKTGTGGSVLPSTAPQPGTGTTTGVSPDLGTQTNPLPTLSPVPLPSMSSAPLPTLSTVPLPTGSSLNTSPLPTLSTAPLTSPTSTSILPSLPALPLPTSTLGLP